MKKIWTKLIVGVLALSMICTLMPAALGEGATKTIRWGTHWVNELDPHFIDEATGTYSITDEADRQLRLAAEEAIKEAYGVEIEYVQYSQDTRNELVLSVLAGNPVCDLALMWGGSENTVLAQNILRPLDQWAADFATDEYSWMLYSQLYGHNYFITNNQILYQRWPLLYNISMIEKVDSLKDAEGNTIYPTTLFKEGKWTWSAFQDYLSKIQAYYANVPAPDGAIYTTMKAYETDYRFAGLSATYAAGGAIYGVDGLSVDSPASIAAANFMATLKEQGLMVDPGVYSDGFVPQWTRAAEDFQKGATVFTDCPDWWIASCCSNATDRGESIGLVPYPRPDSLAFDAEEYRQVVTVGNSWGVLKGIDDETAKLALDCFRLYWATYYKLKGNCESAADYKSAAAVDVAANLGLDIFHEKCGDDILDAFIWNSEKCVPNDMSDLLGMRVKWDDIIGKGLYGIDGMPAYEVAVAANMNQFTEVITNMEAILGSNEIKDNIAPSVSAQGTAAVAVGTDPASIDWSAYFTVTDGFDGVIDPKAGTFDAAKTDFAVVGYYKDGVKGIYADKAGNEGSARVPVAVYNPANTAAPTLTVKAELPTVKMDADVSAIAWADYVDAATDADGIDIKGKLTADVSQLDATTPGEYPVTLTVVDYVGNTATADITVKVVAE